MPAKVRNNLNLSLLISPREIGKGIEAHAALDMSKQLEALQLAHTERKKQANPRIFHKVP